MDFDPTETELMQAVLKHAADLYKAMGALEDYRNSRDGKPSVSEDADDEPR